jgi:hypothetical protein
VRALSVPLSRLLACLVPGSVGGRERVRTPVEGEVHVHYGQIYVESDPDSFGPGLAEAFAGQRAGLCGAATPGALWLTTGLHTGNVGFTIEVHDRAPSLDVVWEDVVEVSFRPVSAVSSLVEWAGEDSWELGLERTDYRVRYCARGMDAARAEDTRLSGEPQLDCYLLQFWPAPPAPDRVLRQTSAVAAYWHDYARRQPPPPTPAERAEAERLARQVEEKAARERRLAHERWDWGGQLPSESLRNVGGDVRGLLRPFPHCSAPPRPTRSGRPSTPYTRPWSPMARTTGRFCGRSGPCARGILRGRGPHCLRVPPRRVFRRTGPSRRGWAWRNWAPSVAD